MENTFKYGDSVMHFTGMLPGKITAVRYIGNHVNYEFSYLDGDTPATRVVEGCEIVSADVDCRVGFCKSTGQGKDAKTKTTN